MKRAVTCLVILMLITLSNVPEKVYAAGVEYYADPSGSGTACTLSSPCSLQTAVDKALPSDHVYLRSGTYTAASPSDDFVLDIKDDLWLFGGCTWTSLADLNCNENNPASILDGEQTRRVIQIDGVTADVSLYNMTIQDGNATSIDTSNCTTWGGTPASGCGGGIFATDLESLIIYNLTFIGNIASSDSSGSSTSFGGAFYANDVEYLDISYSEFENNRAGVSGDGYGGAVYVETSSSAPESYFYNNLFLNNNASTGLDSKGAALMLNQTGRAEIYRNSFIRNNFDDAINMEGSVVYFNEITTSSFSFTDNSVNNNLGLSLLHSYSSSAMYWHDIGTNRFWENNCETNIFLEGVYFAHIRNNFLASSSTILRDRADAQSIYLKGTASSNATAQVFYNSIVGSSSGITIATDVNAYVKNNIIAFNDIGIPKPGDSGYTEIDSNLFYGNTSDGTVGTNPYYGDPKFINMPEGDLHIRKDSEAIDRLASGLGYTTDIDGLNSRPFGDGPTPYDIGADEWDQVNEVFLPIMLR